MKASEWIDRLQAERGWTSDYRVAKELDIAASTLTRYRSKPESTMDDDIAIKVAEALSEPPALVLIDQAAERTKSTRARAEMLDALETVRGKLRAGGALRLAAGGGKGRIDISCVTLAGGDPSELHHSTHRIHWIPLPDLATYEQQRERSEAALLQILANRHAPEISRPTAARH